MVQSLVCELCRHSLGHGIIGCGPEFMWAVCGQMFLLMIDAHSKWLESNEQHSNISSYHQYDEEYFLGVKCFYLMPIQSG